MDSDCRRHRPTAESPTVVGIDVDDETRCAHCHTDRDVVAIRLPCCGTYYPCFRCHDSCVDHEAVQWSRDWFDQPAVLCGVCGSELSVQAYLDSDHRCPTCEAEFNPGC